MNACQLPFQEALDAFMGAPLILDAAVRRWLSARGLVPLEFDGYYDLKLVSDGYIKMEDLS